MGIHRIQAQVFFFIFIYWICWGIKQNINKLKGKKGQTLSCFSVGLRQLTNQYFTYEQLESSRRSIARLIKPKDKVNKKNQKIAQSLKKKVVHVKLKCAQFSSKLCANNLLFLQNFVQLIFILLCTKSPDFLCSYCRPD